MNQFFWREDVDRRVLGAVRCVNDVDGTPLRGPLEIVAAPLPAGQAPDPNAATPLRVLRHRFGLHVLVAGRGFDHYSNTFVPPPTDPPLEARTARLRVIDPSGSFLPADFALRLPRSLLPEDAQHPSVFAPHEVRLLPAPSAPTADGWAVFRVLVWRDLSNDPAPQQVPVAGALVRVLADNAARDLLGRGLTEWRTRPDGSRPKAAEALAAVRDIPVTDWSREPNGNVVTTGRNLRLQVRFDTLFDATAANAMPDLDRLAAAAPPAEVRSAELPATVHLEARERRSLDVVFNAAGTTLREIDSTDLNLP